MFMPIITVKLVLYPAPFAKSRTAFLERPLLFRSMHLGMQPEHFALGLDQLGACCLELSG